MAKSSRLKRNLSAYYCYFRADCYNNAAMVV